MLRLACRLESRRPEPGAELLRTTYQGNALIYELGANRGDNIVYYLARGFRVVAVEANPQLATMLRERFADATATGDVAIEHDRSSVDFYLHSTDDRISSAEAPATSHQAHYTRLTVPARRATSLISQYGPPYAMKIDIEGSDRVVLRDSFSAGCFPDYLAFETHHVRVFCHLVQAGYAEFKIVKGRYVQTPKYGLLLNVGGEMRPYHFPPYSAGPIGEDVPGEWPDIEGAFSYLSEFGFGWKDIHARRQGAGNQGRHNAHRPDS